MEKIEWEKIIEKRMCIYMSNKANTICFDYFSINWYYCYSTFFLLSFLKCKKLDHDTGVKAYSVYTG